MKRIYKEVDYNYDDLPIPIYVKETDAQIAYKKTCFLELAKLICQDVSFSNHLDVGSGPGYLVSDMRTCDRESLVVSAHSTEDQTAVKVRKIYLISGENGY